MRAITKLAREVLGVLRIGGPKVTLDFLIAIAGSSREIVGARSLAPADHQMPPGEYVFRALGETILLPHTAFAGAREMYGRQVYFHRPGFALDGAKVVIDLGSNRGLFSILAARKALKVVAVEAQSGMVEEIRANARRNGVADRVFAELGLIAAGTGVLGDHRVLERASHFGEVPPPLTMDTLFERHQLDHVDFLKIDIEGSEFGLFQGVTGWLERVDRIAMEVHCAFGDPARLREMLGNAGFDAVLVDNDLAEVETLLGQESGYLFAARASRL